MREISVKHVRVVSAVALVAILFGVIGPLFGLVPFDSDTSNARGWNTFGSLLPQLVVFVWLLLTALAVIVGLVGLYFLWAPARWILVGYIVATILTQPFLGLVVFSAYEAGFAGISGTCILWLTTICFWSPFANRLRQGGHTNAA
jgi:hypothetical protein